MLFLYKVTLSAIGMTYMPSKLSRTVDEARSIAADYTLSSLGLPIDGEFILNEWASYFDNVSWPYGVC